MPLFAVEKRDHVGVLTVTSGENRFNPEFIEGFLYHLTAVEADPTLRTLIVRSGHEKIFSNGFDLEWLAPAMERGDTEALKQFFYDANRLLKRTLMSPLMTIAEINGHAFAGGAIWASAFDFRFMRTGRGFFCLPEVDIGIPFLPGMLAILKKAIPPPAFTELIFTGKRLTAEECLARGIVSGAYPLDRLSGETAAFAREINKHPNMVSEIKGRLYHDIVKALDETDEPFIESGSYMVDINA